MTEQLRGPGAPPLVFDLLAEQHVPLLQRQITRRAGLAGGLALLSAAAFVDADQYSADLRWPPHPTRFTPLAGTEDTPPDSEKWFVVGGLGQQISYNAAVEFSHALERKQTVFWADLATHGIDADELADALHHTFKEHDVQRASVVGVSMGLPTFLVGMAELRRRAPRTWMPLPRLERIVGYSSPYDLEDAWQGSLAASSPNFCTTPLMGRAIGNGWLQRLTSRHS